MDVLNFIFRRFRKGGMHLLHIQAQAGKTINVNIGWNGRIINGTIAYKRILRLFAASWRQI